MTKLLCDGELYEQVLYAQESHFESLVEKQLKVLLPDFHVLPFKMFVQGDEGIRRKPDLVLIHKEFGVWAVVEVELAHHSLQQHVFPQIKCFSTGAYDVEHAEYLSNKAPELALSELTKMLRYVEPRVMVVVNSKEVMDRGWSRLADELGAKMTFVESYRSPRDRVIFQVDGYLPRIRATLIARARKHEMINVLQCRPSTYFERHPGDLTIYYDERPMIWRTFVTADSALLTPCSPIEIERRRNYEVQQDSTGRLSLVKL